MCKLGFLRHRLGRGDDLLSQKKGVKYTYAHGLSAGFFDS